MTILLRLPMETHPTAMKTGQSLNPIDQRPPAPKPPVVAVSMQFRRDGGPESVLKAFEQYLNADGREMVYFGIRYVDADAAGEWRRSHHVSSASKPAAVLARSAEMALRALVLAYRRLAGGGWARRKLEDADRAYLAGERAGVFVLGLLLYRRVVRWGRRARPACILSMHFSALPWAARAARRLGVPHVYFEIASPRSRPSSRAARIALRSAARVFAPSNEAADQLVLREGASPRPEVLPWPVCGFEPRNGDSADAAKRRRDGTDPCIFGALGRHSHEKRMSDPLRAASILRREGKRVRLVVVGDGPLFGETEELARELGLGGDIKLVRYLSDVSGFFDDIDVFISPSESEGMSVAMIEALAAGLPVISTAVGGALDIVSPENGSLYQPGDVETLAVEMARLANDPKMRAAMGKKSREVYETYLNPDRIGSRLVRAIDEIAAGGR